MFLTDEPTAPSLGIDLPLWKVRVTARAPLVRGMVVQLDTPLINEDSDNLRVGDDTSGIVNATYVQASAARTGRLIGVTLAAINDTQRGYVALRGIVDVWVSGTGSAGDAITVASDVSGNRLIGIALEAWSTTALIRVLFDGIAGFGTFLESAAVDFPVVTITSPADGAEFDEGDSITFTATATDATDGDVSASLDWTSSLDGAIATNDASFVKSDLTPGLHLITATAQDSDGPPNEGSDSIVIFVHEAAGGASQLNDPPNEAHALV